MSTSSIQIPMEDLITRQINFWEKSRKRPFVKASLFKNLTISQSIGSNGAELGRAIARRLGWQFFDKEIVNYIANNTHVRKNIVELFDEKTRSEMDTLIATILDKNTINKEIYFKQLTKAMITVGQHGNAVIIGRGGNLILPDKMALKVCVIRNFAERVKEYSHTTGDPEKAEKELKKSDIMRSLFIRKNFHKEANNPDNFDIVLNLSKIDLITAENIIIGALTVKYGLSEEELKIK